VLIVRISLYAAGPKAKIKTSFRNDDIGIGLSAWHGSMQIIWTKANGRLAVKRIHSRFLALMIVGINAGLSGAARKDPVVDLRM